MQKIKGIMLLLVVIFMVNGCGKNEAPDISEKIVLYESDYTIENFPYYYESESKELLEYYQDIIDGDYDETCFLEENYDKTDYKQTINETEYYYIGEMKDNKPNGKGAIFKQIDYSYPYVLYILGNFKDGELEGYGLQFNVSILKSDGIIALSYEGNYKDWKREGEGIEYYSGYNEDESVLNNIEILEIENISIYHGVVVRQAGIEYIGEFKNGSKSGSGSQYLWGRLMYTGEFKGDKYSGEGILYDSDGNVKYEGEFKNGEYHGKGILYNEDGLVEYEGKFKYGDYEQ